MKKLIYILLFIGIGGFLQAQQLTQTTPIQELHHIWNPAFTAPGTKMDMSIYYRRQWVGQLNYAYKLKELLNRDDQLSFGINGYFHQYSFDEESITIRDKDDVVLTNGRQSKFIPSFGLGMAYFSSTQEYDGENIFYVGFSALQILASDLLLDEGNAKRERHYFVNMGTKLFGYNHYIEPSFQVNYVNPEIINYVLGAKFELEESFWAGLSYSSVADVAINGGVILNEIGGRYTQLKIGALATINGGSLMSAGASFEFFASYTLDLD